MSRHYGGWAPYVPVAERRRLAERAIAKLRKLGTPVAPVTIAGRLIATTFWGRAWCDNMESYRDYESRLPRGRTYVRNGSVIDLQITSGRITALISGAELYSVAITIKETAKTQWRAICADCAGGIDSLVELLQGRLSKGVMERLCRQENGLFPRPSDIRFSCNCPDHALMCKHVAAALYGVGARLDSDPDLLFVLRGVDRTELVATVGADLPLTQTAAASERLLADDDVAALFGLEMDAPAAAAQATENRGTKSARRGSDKTAVVTPPAGAAKVGAAKKKRTSGPLRPPRALAPKTRAQQNGKTFAAPKPPTAAAAESKRRGAATAPVSLSTPPAAELQRLESPPAGRTRAAKWIGARARKADR